MFKEVEDVGSCCKVKHVSLAYQVCYSSERKRQPLSSVSILAFASPAQPLSPSPSSELGRGGALRSRRASALFAQLQGLVFKQLMASIRCFLTRITSTPLSAVSIRKVRIPGADPVQKHEVLVLPNPVASASPRCSLPLAKGISKGTL